jgi:hypothetical protein
MPPMEMRKLATIQPYWRNPRKNADAVPAVKESIRRYGMNQPLVVDKKGVLVVGHTRFRALLELEVEDVPVIVMDAPAKVIKEYRIADNKTGEIATWDRSALIPEMRDLDVDTMGVFFPDVDLGRMLADDAGGTVRDVKQAEVDAILDKSDRGILKPTLDDKITIECIGCGMKMALDRSTFLNHTGDL